ncbi:conjugal transfer protein TraF [Salisediminibacterium selenitireducens]|uniref:Cytochrome c biogenesis protein transmembrane region n=1 Tax=Bacillus selenitireducens (strain ATCC 700615 / DSM 15326 / MLS10) TaxID=439292 RepID=D6Y054_BACIE|nr:conjugal transfer protein TraF [Salisediminibacterium selenitireducens]ADH98445.1 hypothetical protein Bsel_0923 [[Bacillus] selenitireducens MLS10]
MIQNFYQILYGKQLIPMNRFLLWLMILPLFFTAPGQAGAVSELPPDDSTLLYLYADTCPVCQEATPAVEAFTDEHGLTLKKIDVQEEASRDLVEHVWSHYGVTHRVVPTFVYHDNIMQGFDGSRDEPFAGLLEDGSADPDGDACGEDDETGAVLCSDARPDAADETDLHLLAVIGTTLTIGLTDGFNPCSLWALMFLMSMVLRLKDPKAVYLTGFVFILTITAIYGLFIAGTFAIVTNILGITWLRLLIFSFAALFALINIRDYFKETDDLTLSISDSHKKRWIAFSRGRLNSAGSMWRLALAAFAIGVFASLIELPCTAGYPIVWNGLMVSQGIGGASYAGLLGMYLFMYILVEFVILMLIGRSMKKMTLTAGIAKTMKLVSGTLMLYLAVLLLAGYEAMNNMTLLTGGSLAVIAVTLLYVWIRGRQAS